MSDENASGESGSPKRRPGRVYAIFVALLLVGLTLVWTVWDPAFGDSLKNIATYALGLLFLVGSAVWALALAPTSWSRRVLIAAAFLSPLAVIGAVVRDVEFSGDMAMTWHYRWSEDDSAVRRASAAAPATPGVTEAVTSSSADYAEYRGVARDGRVEAGGADLSESPKEIWRRDVGAGWAGMAVVDSLLVTLEQIGSDEAIVCYDTQSGDELWRDTYSASFDEAMGGPGPRSTPTIVDDSLVYTFGALGHLTCVDLLSGKRLWQVDTLAKYGVENLQWAESGSPLVRDGRVYINTGSTGDGGLTCFDALSGDEIWRASKSEWDNKKGKNAAGYSSPMFATIDDVEQIIMFDGLALRGHDIASGAELWSFPFTNDALVNVAQPIVFDDGRVFIAASYGVGCEMLRVTSEDGRWSVASVWKEPRLMRCKFTSPVERDGFLYGLDEGVLECLNAETGQREWKKGRYGHGQILLVDDKILVMAEDGRVVVVRATPDGLDELHETSVFPDAARNWNPASLSRGRVFVRNHEEMARLDFPGAGADVPPSTGTTDDVTEDSAE